MPNWNTVIDIIDQYRISIAFPPMEYVNNGSALFIKSNVYTKYGKFQVSSQVREIGNAFIYLVKSYDENDKICRSPLSIFHTSALNVVESRYYAEHQPTLYRDDKGLADRAISLLYLIAEYFAQSLDMQLSYITGNQFIEKIKSDPLFYSDITNCRNSFEALEYDVDAMSTATNLFAKELI